MDLRVLADNHRIYDLDAIEHRERYITGVDFKMKVISYSRYGGPEVVSIQENEKPVPGDHEVLIRIHSTTLTATETIFRRGPLMPRLFTGLFRPKLQILGEELAGTVEQIGKDVQRFKTGDRVFGITGPNFGAHAEYIVLPGDSLLLHVPDNLSFDEAAGSCDGFLTALPFLRDVGKIQSGQKVIIYGASGSVGSAAVQVARMFGAEVTAVCSASNHELVRSLGASHTVDYRSEDFTQNGKIYDIIFDTVGKLSYTRASRSLSERGIFLEAGIGFSIFPMVLWTALFGKKKLKIAATGLRDADEKSKDLELIREKLQSGEFKPVIDRVFQMNEIVEAHRYVDTGRKRGNVIIRMI